MKLIHAKERKKRKGTVSSSLVLLKVRKAAWQATEEEDIGQAMS